jgi:hypothetical protein
MRHRRLRVLALLGLAALASCDSPSGPKPAGAPARLDIVLGDLQTAVVGTQLAAPLVVKVTDDRGRAVKGQTVVFRVTAGNGTVLAGTDTTDQDGLAQDRWTLGTAARDTQKVEARAVEASTGATLVFGTLRAVGTPDAPATLARVAGDAQAGPVGAVLADSLAVKLADRYGNGVAGLTVAFAVTSGGGSVSPASRATDSTGVARAQWKLGARLDTAQAAVALFGALPPVAFAATATVAGTLAKVSGDGQTAAVGHFVADSLAVRLTAADGSPVRGATIQWSTSGGSLVPATSVTDANGTAKTSWLLGTAAGQRTATAAVFGTSTSVSFAATAAPGPAERVVVVSGDRQRAPFGTPVADSLAVRALDHDGNPVPGVSVTWTVQGGGGSVSPAAYATDAAGIARTRWTLGLGPDTLQNVRAALPTTAGVTLSATATLGGSVVLTRVSGDNQSGAGGSVLADSVVVRLTNGSGAPLVGITVEWVPYMDGVAVGGSASPSSSATDAGGYAKTSWRLPTSTSAATLRMKVGGAFVDEAFRATVLSAAPASVTVQGNTSLQGPPGSTFPVSVRVLDAGGNPVANVEVRWAVTSGGGAVVPAVDSTDAGGVARTQWTLGPANGSNTLTATATGLTPAQLYATARSSGTLTVRIDYPTTLHPEPDSLFVAATVQSTYVLSSVTAQVQGRTVAMFPSATYGWEGILNLAGLPRGPLEVKVSAVDAQNDTAIAVRTFVHDNPPHLNVTSPLQYAVARPSLHVVADCTDDDPAGCSSIAVYVGGTASPLASQNGTHFDGTVSLAAYEGTRVRFEVRARDSAGNTTSVFDSVAVESSANLAPVDSVSGRILDATADRILFVNRTNRFGTLKVRDRGTGAEQTVYSGTAPDDSVMGARLTPTACCTWSTRAARRRRTPTPGSMNGGGAPSRSSAPATCTTPASSATSATFRSGAGSRCTPWRTAPWCAATWSRAPAPPSARPPWASTTSPRAASSTTPTGATSCGGRAARPRR